MSKFHAIYSKGGASPEPGPGPVPEPSTSRLVHLGSISSTLNIASAAQAAGLNTRLMNVQNFLLVPKNWTINASGGSKVNEEKTESGANSGSYGIAYSTETAILTVSNQPNCNIQGGQAFATANAIVTFDAYYFDRRD